MININVERLCQVPDIINTATRKGIESNGHDKLLLVISEHSEIKTSYRALTVAVKEALGKEGLANERKASSPILLPIHLDKTPQEMGGVWARRIQLAKRQRRDFTSWNDQNAYQKAFDQLLHDLKASIPSHQERK